MTSSGVLSESGRLRFKAASSLLLDSPAERAARCELLLPHLIRRLDSPVAELCAGLRVSAA